MHPPSHNDILNSMPDGVLVLDQRGAITSWNNVAPRLLAVAPAEWVGQPLLAAIAASPLAADVRALLASGAPTATRSSSYTAASGLIGVEMQVQPVRDSAGACSGTLLLLRDVTQHVRAEQSRNRRIEELALLNQIARVANAALDTEEVLQAVVRAASHTLDWDRLMVALSQSDGVTLRTVINEPLRAGVLHEGRTGIEDDHSLMLDLIQGRKTRVLYATEIPEEMLTDSAVRRRAFQVTGTHTGASLRRLGLEMMLAVPLYSADKPLGMLFMTSSAARPVALDELQLCETIGTLVSDAIARTAFYEEVRQSNQLKTVFLASVTHELRSPMTSIIGFTDMLSRGAFGPLPEMVAEPIDMIRYSSKRLLRVINDILDFSKMEAGRLKMDLYTVEMDSVLRTVVGTMKPQLEERRIALHIDMPADTPKIHANSARLEQVLINLVANAIKFTEQGSITVRAEQQGETVLISVQDTGIGIEPEHQQMIFEPFRQIEHHQRRYGGTGLGLAISKRLVEMMGGTLELQSVVGVGSTFTCTLWAAEAGPSDSVAVPVPVYTRPRTLLDMLEPVAGHQ